MFLRTFSHLSRNKTANELNAKRKDFNSMTKNEQTHTQQAAMDKKIFMNENGE